MQVRGSAISLIAVAMGAAAFLSPSPVDGAAATPTACSLLSQAQVGAVLGISVAAGQPMVPGSTSPCMWSQQGRPVPSEKRVLVFLQDPNAYTTGKKPLAGLGITIAPASGIGDDAYFSNTPGQGTSLNVRKGAVAFSISVYGFPEDQIKAKEKALAQNILTKL